MLSRDDLLGSLESYEYNDGLGVTISTYVEDEQLVMYVYGDTVERAALGTSYSYKWKLVPVDEQS